MYDTDDDFPKSDTGIRYSDDLRQLAYEIWLLKADRNATRTQMLLAEQCRADAEEQIDDNTGEILSIEDESLNIPTVRQVQRWAKDGNWSQKAADDIARLAPRMYKDFNARLFTQIEAAQQLDFDILSGKYGNPNSPGILAVMEKVAARLQTLAGVGTAAGLMPVSMPSAPPQALTGSETPQDLARIQREKIRELRGGS
jgi:hypothetical protein